MDDDYEIIDEDLDYVLLFDEENKQTEKKNGPGCCFILILLFSSIPVGISISKFIA